MHTNTPFLSPSPLRVVFRLDRVNVTNARSRARAPLQKRSHRIPREAINHKHSLKCIQDDQKFLISSEDIHRTVILSQMK